MKSTASLPGKETREACVDCRTMMPVTLLRVVTKNPPSFRCTNQAACRKRQRQYAARAPKGKK